MIMSISIITFFDVLLQQNKTYITHEQFILKAIRNFAMYIMRTCNYIFLFLFYFNFNNFLCFLRELSLLFP